MQSLAPCREISIYEVDRICDAICQSSIPQEQAATVCSERTASSGTELVRILAGKNELVSRQARIR